MAQVPHLDAYLTPELLARRAEMLEQRHRPNLGFYDQLMVHPELFDKLSALGTMVRFHGLLPARVREAAVLMVGAELRSDFEWATHQASARAAGLDDATIERIGTGGELDPELGRLREAVLHVVRMDGLPQPAFDALIEAYGVQGAVEVVALASMYRMFACLGAAFDATMPGGAKLP